MIVLSHDKQMSFVILDNSLSHSNVCIHLESERDSGYAVTFKQTAAWGMVYEERIHLLSYTVKYRKH